MTVNPLAAASIDGGTDPWSGVWIAEDIERVAHDVRDRSWVDGSLGVVAAGLDALGIMVDPAGVLLQYGVAWLIEHVRPLSAALDWLAGDPATIAAQVQAWRSAAADLHAEAGELISAVRSDVPQWTGVAACAYRSWAAREHRSIEALATAADAMAAITEGAGTLIAAVRILIRDAIAALVSRLIVYAAEEVASLGLATPLVAAQAGTLIASWAARIARWLRSLLGSLRALTGRAERLQHLVSGLHKPHSHPPRRSVPPSIGDPARFDPRALRGLTPDAARACIPRDWERIPSTRGGGEVFRDPAHPGRQVRIMPGYPSGSRADPITWGPYVVVSQNGRVVKIPLRRSPAP